MDTTPINPTPADSVEQPWVETVGDYLIHHDPMDDLGCDSCQ